MTRSTKADKARQLNAAYALLQRDIPLPEAMQHLSREFDLSERQALPVPGGGGSSGSAGRSLRSYGPDHAQASSGDGKSSSGLCEKKWPDDWNNRDTCVGGVSACSEKAWLSRAQDAGRFKFSLTIRLIACTIRKSPKPTVFWRLFGSVPSAAA